MFCSISHSPTIFFSSRVIGNEFQGIFSQTNPAIYIYLIFHTPSFSCFSLKLRQYGVTEIVLLSSNCKLIVRLSADLSRKDPRLAESKWAGHEIAATPTTGNVCTKLLESFEKISALKRPVVIFPCIF